MRTTYECKHGTCKNCDSFEADGLCHCDDSNKMLDRVDGNDGCAWFQKRRTPADGEPTSGPCTCKSCGAYIPTGHKRCLACGTVVYDRIETARFLLGNGFAPPTTIDPPPPPPLPKSRKVQAAEKEIRKIYDQMQKDEPVDLDLDNLTSKTIRIRYNGVVRTCKLRVDIRSEDYNYADILMFHTK